MTHAELQDHFQIHYSISRMMETMRGRWVLHTLNRECRNNDDRVVDGQVNNAPGLWSELPILNYGCCHVRLLIPLQRNPDCDERKL